MNYLTDDESTKEHITPEVITCPRCTQTMHDADCAEGCEDFKCPMHMLAAAE